MTVYGIPKKTVCCLKTKPIEFPHLRKQYWGRHFWARGYFSATSGNITDDVINQYINNHSEAHKTADTNIRLE